MQALNKTMRNQTKVKASFQISPRLKNKGTKKIPGEFLNSLDSNTLTIEKQRLKTPQHNPSQKTFQKVSASQNLMSKKNLLIGKPTVKLTINLCEEELKNPKKPDEKKKPMTPQTKVVLFNLDVQPNHPKPGMICSNMLKLSPNPNVPSSTLNLSNICESVTSSTKVVNASPAISESHPPAVSGVEEMEEARKELVNNITKHFSFKQKPPITNPNFYRTYQHLGKGSFGKVLLCCQLLTEKPVAIKVIEKSQLKNHIAEKRVLQEIQLLKRLDHKNVVKLLEVFESDTTIYLVMEYINKGDLYSLLKREKKGRLTEIQARPIFLQILRGLDYIHSQGVLHRDIKLDNILLDNNNTIKICDFGISRMIIPDHRMTEQSGTPAFMAPEIIAGQGYEGYASDLWSLGVVLYSLLTGTLPFRGNNSIELNENILKGSFNKEIKVSNEVKDLLEKLLNVNPAERITMKEIWGQDWISKETSSEETVNLMPGKTSNLNEEIVKKIKKFGYPKEYIIKTLEKKSFGHVNVCYQCLQE